MWKFAALVVAVFAVVFFVTPGKDAAESAAAAESATNAVAAPADNAGVKVDGLEDDGSVKLAREADGHFYVDAQVNGTSIRMLVDTGASSVALTEEDAANAGITFGDDEFNEVGRGVGGDIEMKSVKLASLSVGSIDLTDVDAVVAKSEMPVSLLGQTWLKRVANVSIQGDIMTLSQL